VLKKKRKIVTESALCCDAPTKSEDHVADELRSEFGTEEDIFCTSSSAIDENLKSDVRQFDKAGQPATTVRGDSRVIRTIEFSQNSTWLVTSRSDTYNVSSVSSRDCSKWRTSSARVYKFYTRQAWLSGYHVGLWLADFP